MGAGRKPKATEVLKKQGTYRADRHKSRVKVEKKLVDKPSEWLTAEEKAVWTKWYEYLQTSNILKETDEVAFGLLCKTFNRVDILSRDFKTADDYIISHISDVGAPTVKKDPKYEIMDAEEKKLLKLLTEFGMTPASRSKVKQAIQDDEDPFKKLLDM